MFLPIKFFAAIVSTVMLMASCMAVAKDVLEVKITYFGRSQTATVPLSLLDVPVMDNGIPGSVLGLKDNQTTGSFLNQTFTLDHVLVDPEDDLLARYKDLVDNGAHLFLTDLDAADLISLVEVAPDVLLMNIRAKDNALRNALCHRTVFHLAPSRAMIADALAQYLAWKRWKKIVLVTGRHPEDRAYADALRRSVPRFGLKLVQEKDWTSVPGARRTDSGHHSLQQEVPAFTQFKDHDIVVVADEHDEFGEYLSYRSAQPRPIAGTQGLVPTAWSRTHEQWGATQIQRRFTKLSNRVMTERDYAAWLAMRALGEAVTNTSSADPETLRSFLLSDKFKLAGFKGVPLTFRDWNGQLRQPVLVTGARMLVSVSPQKGYLHEHSELDTLGYDKPETGCEAF